MGPPLGRGATADVGPPSPGGSAMGVHGGRGLAGGCQGGATQQSIMDEWWEGGLGARRGPVVDYRWPDKQQLSHNYRFLMWVCLRNDIIPASANHKPPFPSPDMGTQQPMSGPTAPPLLILAIANI